METTMGTSTAVRVPVATTGTCPLRVSYEYLTADVAEAYLATSAGNRSDKKYIQANFEKDLREAAGV